jgi:hypothetical protein
LLFEVNDFTAKKESPVESLDGLKVFVVVVVPIDPITKDGIKSVVAIPDRPVDVDDV